MTVLSCSSVIGAFTAIILETRGGKWAGGGAGKSALGFERAVPSQCYAGTKRPLTSITEYYIGGHVVEITVSRSSEW